jgi:hypothetical protein
MVLIRYPNIIWWTHLGRIGAEPPLLLLWLRWLTEALLLGAKNFQPAARSGLLTKRLV